jgi:drug/metabolite transporter (DMT)-like permease
MLRVGAVAWVFFALQVLGGPAIAVVRPKVIHTTSPKPFRWYGVGLAISAGLVLMLSLAIAFFRGEINRVVNGSALLNLAFACLVPGTHFLLWYKAAETILSLRIRRQS